ncbi:unnamed protein product [Knipowitschia caucasica]|uniref:CRIB domain-containing protein n=1 Tax=Knipowitschia caucasica TaxID=637954 RepID=A0AAV2LTR9_KNICA
MNLQEKLSGLKGLVTHSHSKRRFKGDLSTDMISPPLGDFRHTMHVGRGGDVFGDTSFLSNHGGTANGTGSETSSISSPDNKIGAFFSRTLRHIRRGSDNRASPVREPEKELSPPPPAVSPIIKNAVSLPRLDGDLSNGTPTRVLFPSSPSTPPDGKTSYGVDSGFVTLPRLSRSERQQPSISLPCPPSPLASALHHRGSLPDSASAAPVYLTSDPNKYTAFSDSLPSLASLDFTFDLGPSLMSEVLGFLDGVQAEAHTEAQAEEHTEEPAWEEEGSACGSATISYVDSLLREDCGGGKSPHWEDEEADGRAFRMPDVVMGAPERPKGGGGMGMESERFQSAADVLARHYGGSLKGHKTDLDSFSKRKISYSYIEDEDEIKV